MLSCLTAALVMFFFLYLAIALFAAPQLRAAAASVDRICQTPTGCILAPCDAEFRSFVRASSGLKGLGSDVAKFQVRLRIPAAEVPQKHSSYVVS